MEATVKPSVLKYAMSIGASSSLIDKVDVCQGLLSKHFSVTMAELVEANKAIFLYAYERQ